MVNYKQNKSPISIEGLNHQGEIIQILGNGNDIYIGDTNSVLMIQGNANVVNIVHSKLKIITMGNGNNFNSIESHLQLQIKGNANTFNSESQINPIQILSCQGFANIFPNNAINNSINSNNNQSLNHFGLWQGQHQKNTKNNYPFNNLPNLFQNQQCFGSFENNNTNKIISYQQPGFIQQKQNSNNSQNQNIKLQRMVSEQLEKEFPSFNSNNLQKILQQQIKRPQMQPKKAEKQVINAQMVGMIQAKKAQQQAHRAQQQSQRIFQQQLKEQQRQQRQQLREQLREQQRLQAQQQRRQQKQQAQLQRHQAQLQRQQTQLQRQQFNKDYRRRQFGDNFGNQLLFPSINDIFGVHQQENNKQELNHYKRSNIGQNWGNRNMSFNQGGNNNSGMENNNRKEQNVQKKKEDLPDHGLSQSQIQRLKTHSHHGQEQQCTICFLEIYTNDQAMFLNCFHQFHSYCIQSWLKKCSKCPICNENVRKNFA